MAITNLADAARIIKDSRSPLIIIPRDPDTDALAAGLAAMMVLERLKKSPHLVSPGFRLLPQHGFLPQAASVKQDLTSLRNFVITVDTSRTKIDALSYNVEGEKLRIYLNPKNGFFESSDVTTSSGAFAYDAVIVIGVAALADLGDMYSNNAEFFYQTPTISIDHRAGHQRYGQVNLIDVVASSSSEIVFELFQHVAPDQIDEQVATNMLAGIISRTRGFQSAGVTPRSLSVASHLISAGARREEIVRHLYQTKTVSGLKVWGRALSNIKTDDRGTMWTVITKEDMRLTGATTEEAAGALDELLTTASNMKTVILFLERHEGTEVHLYATDPTTLKLPAALLPISEQYFRGVLDVPIARAVQQLTGK